MDTETALAADPQVREISWTTTDLLLDHLSLGAGAQADHPELTLTFERALEVLPTFGLVAGKGPSAGGSGSAAKTADAPSDPDGCDGAEAHAATAADPTRDRRPRHDVELGPAPT